MTNSWSMLAGFTHIKHKTDSIFRGSTLSERMKKMDQEACLPTSTEADKIQVIMDQEILEKERG